MESKIAVNGFRAEVLDDSWGAFLLSGTDCHLVGIDAPEGRITPSWVAKATALADAQGATEVVAVRNRYVVYDLRASMSQSRGWVTDTVRYRRNSAGAWYSERKRTVKT